MADLRLASAGDTIKVWDCNGFSQLKQFNPHTNQNISSICWSNHTASCIASASAGDNKISFSYLNDPSLDYSLQVGEGLSCLAFNSTSRYVISGDATGIVQIWDSKSKGLKKTYSGHKGAVTSVQMNANNSDIASGSTTGDIIIYNVVTGQGSVPLNTRKVQAVRQIQYSSHTRSMLGVVSDDGSLNLWDPVRRTLIHSFAGVHMAPAVGIAFSKINPMLMMTVGLDKRIVCYDVQKLEILSEIMAESPLTSIDVMNDGSTFVVGSTRGKIYVYDLRIAPLPVQQMSAHKSSVQCLAFQPTSTSSMGGTHGKTHGSATHKNNNNTAKIGSSRKSVPVIVPSTESTAQRYESQSNINRVVSQGLDSRNNNRVEGIEVNRESAGGESAFSPIKERAPAGSTGQAETSSISNTSLSKYGIGVFSPIGDAGDISARTEYGSNSMSGHLAGRLANCSLDQSYVPPTSDAYHTSTSQPTSLTGLRSGAEPVEFHHSKSDPVISPPTKDCINRSVSNPIKITYPANTPDDAGATGGAYEPHSKAITNVTRLHNSGASPEASSSRYLHSNEQSPQQQTTNNASPSTFQMELVRKVVEETMEDFQDQIRRDVLNMHMDMLKQFQKQHNEFKTLLQKYSVNDELLAEIERLRDENEKLKIKL